MRRNYYIKERETRGTSDCSRKRMFSEDARHRVAAHPAHPNANWPCCFLLALTLSFRNLEACCRTAFPWETRDSEIWKTEQFTHRNPPEREQRYWKINSRLPEQKSTSEPEGTFSVGEEEHRDVATYIKKELGHDKLWVGNGRHRCLYQKKLRFSFVFNCGH